jgi:hypothetical protein
VSTAVVLGARNLGGAITRDLLAREVRVATIAALGPTSMRWRPGPRRECRRCRPGRTRRGPRESAAELGPPDLIVNAVSSSRPPNDASGFGGGALAARVPPASRAGRWQWLGRRSRSFRPVCGARGHGGTLVQVTGAPARRANAERGLVSAGSAAARSLTQAAAQEWRERGIHVALCCGRHHRVSQDCAYGRGVATDALVQQEDVVRRAVPRIA